MIGIEIYKGKNVELTEVDAEKEAALFAQWTRRPAVYHRMMSGKYHAVNENEMKKKLTDDLKAAEEKGSSYYFDVRLRSDQKIIGFAQFPLIYPTHQFGRFFIDFENEDDLVTYGDETLGILLHYGFMEVNLHRISSPVPGYETKMIALYERNGLIREVQRREAVYHDGTYYDEYEYGILKPDYKKRNQEGLQ